MQDNSEVGKYKGRVGDGHGLVVGFRNVSIPYDLFRLGIKERMLRQDIVSSFNAHDLDVLCLSGLCEIWQGIGSKLPHGL